MEISTSIDQFRNQKMHQAARKKLKSLKKKKLSCQNCCLTLNCCFVSCVSPAFYAFGRQKLGCWTCWTAVTVKPKLFVFLQKNGPNGCANIGENLANPLCAFFESKFRWNDPHEMFTDETWLHATMQHCNGENATDWEVATCSVSSFTKQQRPSNTWPPVDDCCATCWVGKGDGWIGQVNH